MKNLQLNNILFVILGISLFVYIFVRAQHLSITHDESLSFTIISGDSSYIKSANNHILNTKLMKISSSMFGNNELALRLPNVLSFILYLFSGFFILKTIKNKLVFYLGFALLYLNPFLIDYFSLARGYGLSIAFMLASILFLLKQNYKVISGSKFSVNLFFSMAFAALAMWANFNLINFFIAVLVAHTLVLFYTFKVSNFDSNLVKLSFTIIVIFCLVNLVYAVNTLFKLNDLKQLYYGEDHFFDSIKTIIHFSFYRSIYPDWISSVLSSFFFVFIIVTILSIVVKDSLKTNLAIIGLLVVLIIISLYIENKLFYTKFPSDRTALYLVPLIALFFCFTLEHFIEHYSIKKLVYLPTIILICFFIVFNFFRALNFEYSKSYFYDCSSKNAMKTIELLTENSKKNLTISNNWIHEPIINYYIKTKNLKLMNADRNGINYNSEFIFAFNSDSIPNNYLKKQDFILTNTSLWQKKH
jgi:hypothetical protein